MLTPGAAALLHTQRCPWHLRRRGTCLTCCCRGDSTLLSLLYWNHSWIPNWAAEMERFWSGERVLKALMRTLSAALILWLCLCEYAGVFYTATPLFCSCFPNLLNSALPNTGPPADPSDLLRSSHLSRQKSTCGTSSIAIPKRLPHLRASSAWCHVSPLRVCHV